MHLEKKTEAFLKDLKAQKGKPVHRLKPEEARAVLEKAQSGNGHKTPIKIDRLTIPGGPHKEISLRIFRPQNGSEKLPVLMYFHGAGWVMGSAATHDRLVRELAVGGHCAVVFVNYDRAPENTYPCALEEAYTATKYIAEHGHKYDLDTSFLAIGGDSVGGNMAIGVSLLAKERNGPKIDFQLLFYPVTSSDMNTPSYRKYAKGPWLTKPAMQYFWNAYAPDKNMRKDPRLSPLNAKKGQLKDLPPTLLITAENDVLRDEGELFAEKLSKAGVPVTAIRFLGTIHDFMMLNALADTPAARGALALANSHLNEAFQSKRAFKTQTRAA